MNDLTAGHLKITTTDFVTTLEIHNPRRRNAMNFQMWSDLGQALATLQDDANTRVLVVTGAGDRAFCAGNDISEFEHWRTDPERSRIYANTAHGATAALRDFPKPVITAIKGFCIGGGLELALLGDIRMSTQDASFAITPARLGLGYDLNDTDLLVSRLGGAAAREMLFTAAMYSADDAMRLGIVSHVHASAEFDAAVNDIVAKIAGNAPLTVQASKAIVAQAEKPSAERDTALCDALVRKCYESEDFAEGRAAFAEKRKPEFKGR